MIPKYVGTKSGLTGIPSLLLSSLQQVEDPAAKTALYETQNWANSFEIFNFGTFNGAYITGGVAVGFKNVYPNQVDAFVVTPFEATGGASQAAPTILNNSSALVVLWTPLGAQIANGVTVQFSWISVGH